MQAIKDKKVLVAALDWGLGHASRCVPVIRNLQKNGYEVILASNGNAEKFFRNYFPGLTVIKKPGYDITYPNNKSMASEMLRQLPSIILTIFKEHLWLKKIIREYGITEVISDNCYGLWNRKIHSVFITHQLMVKCPGNISFMEPFISRCILSFINKYDECYIPDWEGRPNLSGKLSHQINKPPNARFIGILSRFSDNKNETETTSFDLVVLLSGPEPQRTIFENLCENLITTKNKKCCIIRGMPGSSEIKNNTNEITWFNHLPDDELKAILCHAKKVVCRPGYSTIMDMVTLNVRAMFVPTPGQTEQEYLAQHLYGNDQFETINQDKLTFYNLFKEVNRPAIRRITIY